MMVQNLQHDPSLDLMLDGNAAAGLLREVFGAEMTASRAKCASCHTVSQIGEMLVFGGAMGNIMRCPHCHGMMMRVMSSRNAVWLDMQGVSCLRKERNTALPVCRLGVKRV
jgi:hypothetical protein